MFVSYHKTTQCHTPEDLDVNLHRCENLKISHEADKLYGVFHYFPSPAIT
jgi:hypothetical protein